MKMMNKLSNFGAFKHALFAVTCGLVLIATSAHAQADLGYESEINSWREHAETSLRRDNGWLTLAGRYVLNEGMSTVGTAADNDVVLAPGLGPERLGTITIGVDMAVLTLNPGVSMTAQGKDGPQTFTGERVLKTNAENRDWISLGRLAFHVITRQHEGKPRFVLRVADNENSVRKNFPGRLWFGIDPSLRINAQFVPYKSAGKNGKKISIVNVLDEVSEENAAGYVKFKIKNKSYKLDALADDKDDELFIILKDTTAGQTTYGSGRFMAVPWPVKVRKTGGAVVLDFNKAYNPPCAFSQFTTCPLPPAQNQLPISIQAGEKYREKTVSQTQSPASTAANDASALHASARCNCPEHRGQLSFSKLGTLQ